MRTNGTTDMQPCAALMRGMNIEDQALAVERALLKVNKNVVLVQDRDTRVCWINGQLKRHTPGARRNWTCRKITPMQLVKLAPAKRIFETLEEIVE